MLCLPFIKNKGALLAPQDSHANNVQDWLEKHDFLCSRASMTHWSPYARLLVSELFLVWYSSARNNYSLHHEPLHKGQLRVLHEQEHIKLRYTEDAHKYGLISEVSRG